ncbi:hypothetical protein [Afipia sp. GAS231]|uniref:hypothetical protein n=1 Tax=Afipia sp. GAS231 TaxID=1882747 RepID=UPI00087C4FB6|nr:hypothetical protein [Afipia sp. GAS231]SDP49273.1 hypothetical protein SAMN05444050_7046 [Afipia sp. GAS231]
MSQIDEDAETPLKDDTLYGAKEIANFLGCTQRKVFYYKEKKLVPLGCIGSQIIGSKRALRLHFKAQMVGAE